MQRQKFGSLIRFSSVLCLSLLVVMLGGLLKPEAAVQPVSFGAKTDFITGNVPVSVAVGDFNGDGKLDLAVANILSATVSILLGTGTGSLGAKTDFGTGVWPNSVATGDFNGDGKLDLAVVNQLDATVSILLGTGTGSFGAKTDFGTGSHPISVAVGDFNGDGTLDLAVANINSDNVSILLGTGTGSFGAKTDFGMDTGSNPHAVAVGDFNGDGKLDLAVNNTSATTNAVSILLGTGTGSFGAKNDFDTGNSPNSVAVGDFNGDGTLDLAVANFGAASVSILLGMGTGSFGAKTDFGTDSFPVSVAVGDFNRDGKLDLVTANYSSNTVSILLGTGTGSFGAKADFGTGSTPDTVAVGDFNGDGKLDLATENRGGDTASILLGTGTGSFAAKADFGTGHFPISVVVGDFNGDGKLDLAVANSFDDTVSILLGTGTGSFGAKTDFGTGTAPSSVAVGDFNGDGNLDLAVANFFSGTVSILLGTGTGSFGAKSDFGTGSDPVSLAVGDFDGDGKLDLAVANVSSAKVSILPGTGTGSFGAKTDFGTGFNPYSVAVGDFNGDGKLDLAVVNIGGNTVSILLGTGTGSFGAKTDFGTGSRPDSVAVGDFNGDDKLDLALANQGDNTVSILLNTCNTPPSITAAPVTRTAGNPSANSQIALVDDAQDAPNTLSVTVNGGTSATVTGVTITLNPTAPNASGQVFADLVAACGATTANFTLRVTDSGGLFTEATLTVTVNPDNQPPTITCPAPITQNTDPNVCTAVETFADPTVTDNCPPCNDDQAKPGKSPATQGCSVVCSPVSGSTFQRGLTTVTCTATDASNNTAQCMFTITVNDTQPPAITCPANTVHGTDPNVCQAVVTYPAPVVSDNCPGVGAPTCSPASGSTFPKGTTTVTCTVKDSSNNMSMCSFLVTVNDTQPPVFPNGCPAGITKAAQASCPFTTTLLVTYTTPIATDNCPPPPTVVCNPPSGSIFPPGTTVVTCTATDGSGNTATCTFPVNVFSFCLQDDSTDNNVVFVNALTGDYQFCQNGVPIASGTGTLVVHGCNFQIDHTKGDRKVHIQGDTSANSGMGSGTAYIQKSGGGFVVQITDRKMNNNNCTCSPPVPPPAPTK